MSSNIASASAGGHADAFYQRLSAEVAVDSTAAGPRRASLLPTARTPSQTLSHQLLVLQQLRIGLGAPACVNAALPVRSESASKRP